MVQATRWPPPRLTRFVRLAVNRKDRDERRAVRGELRQLAKEERKRQEKAVEEVLREAQVRGVEQRGS